MNKKSKLFLAFGAGALVGAGILALFTTDKGKALTEKAKRKAGDFKKTIKNFENEMAGFFDKNESMKNTKS